MLDDMRAQVKMQQENHLMSSWFHPPWCPSPPDRPPSRWCPEPAVLGSPVEIVELEPLPGGVCGYELDVYFFLDGERVEGKFKFALWKQTAVLQPQGVEYRESAYRHASEQK